MVVKSDLRKIWRLHMKYCRTNCNFCKSDCQDWYLTVFSGTMTLPDFSLFRKRQNISLPTVLNGKERFPSSNFSRNMSNDCALLIISVTQPESWQKTKSHGVNVSWASAHMWTKWLLQSMIRRAWTDTWNRWFKKRFLQVAWSGSWMKVLKKIFSATHLPKRSMK